MLAMPIANSGTKAIALLSLNGNTQNFQHLCIYGIKTQYSTDLPGLFILTISCFFLLFWWWWSRWGTERSNGIVRVASTKDRLFENKCVCWASTGTGNRRLGHSWRASFFVPQSWHSALASVLLWMVFPFKLFISCSEYQSEESRVSSIYRLYNSSWNLFLVCTVLRGLLNCFHD